MLFFGAFGPGARTCYAVRYLNKMEHSRIGLRAFKKRTIPYRVFPPARNRPRRQFVPPRPPPPGTEKEERFWFPSYICNGSELPSYLWKDKRNCNIWKNRVTLKLKIGKLEERKFNHHFQETSCSVSAAMLNFCSHSTTKNGLIQASDTADQRAALETTSVGTSPDKTSRGGAVLTACSGTI
uniref:Uncharacterized protein n=1 Tax=Populus alba TaxID=43335 RepID=A0A4U5MP05_POPAL|nr:hypothetical protein D5086_0000302020 [Populus alba]